jgi:hypothetical protein
MFGIFGHPVEMKMGAKESPPQRTYSVGFDRITDKIGYDEG